MVENYAAYTFINVFYKFKTFLFYNTSIQQNLQIFRKKNHFVPYLQINIVSLEIYALGRKEMLKTFVDIHFQTFDMLIFIFYFPQSSKTFCDCK